MHADERDHSSATGIAGRRALPASPAGATPLHPLAALQHAVGNAALTRAIQRSQVPPLPTLQQALGNAALTRAIQRSEQEHGSGCAHEGPAAQRRSSLFEAVRSPGSPLEPRIRQKAEQAYGMRFDHVRVHDDPVAQRSAQELGASAYTTGSDIVVGPQGVDDETFYHEIDRVRQQALGSVAGSDDGTGVKVSHPDDPFERASSANGRRLAHGDAPDLSIPGSHGQSDAVQRATEAPAVQRMESPPRGRPGGAGYEADAESSESDHGRDSDSSPDRREFRDRVEQVFGEGPDLDDIGRRLDRMAANPPAIRRIRAIHHSDSESDPPRRAAPAPAPAPAPAQAPAPAEARVPELPENDRLKPLHELLTRELHEGGVTRKLKVTLMVDGGEYDPRQTGNVGHAWIEIAGSGGQEVSFGFYPTEQYRRVHNVRGGVQCPDRYGHATHHESANVPLGRIAAGYTIVHERTRAAYNLTLHNCATFAGAVWKAMTGRDVPRELLTAYGVLSTVVSTPRGTAEGIAGHQERRREGRRERLRPLAEGPARGLMPGPGTAEEVADRMARARLSQSSSSQSSEEVD